MPKTSIPANGNHSPALSRRRVLTGTMALALSPTPARHIPEYGPDEPDNGLALLGVRFGEAFAHYAAAERHRNECERRYLDDGPMPPCALTAAGPLGKLLSSEWRWWDVEDLQDLLADRTRRRHWHAACALLPVAQAYAADDKRFDIACGFSAAEAGHRAAIDALNELAEAILMAQVRSRQDFAVPARVVKLWTRPEWWSENPSHADPTERFVSKMIDRIL
jgi:hypothetical protein